jgi:hypothetical protein
VDVPDLLDQLDGGAPEWIDRPADFRKAEAAWGAAARMSVARRSSSPPPTQSPLTAATMGFEYAWVFRSARLENPGRLPARREDRR